MRLHGGDIFRSASWRAPGARVGGPVGLQRLPHGGESRRQLSRIERPDCGRHLRRHRRHGLRPARHADHLRTGKLYFYYIFISHFVRFHCALWSNAADTTKFQILVI